MRNVLCSHDLSIDLRVRMISCYIFSVLLYGVEAWTLNEAFLKRLTPFEMWVYRRLLKISWVDRVRNEEVLRRLNQTTQLVNIIKKRKLEYFSHIMRHPEKYIQGNIQEEHHG
ncbi:unnamed protein product [Diabrotica balteata]|uniref:Uncharacterized protein n=1 Tax=Diabrotica balteata TaxID=107213 RepID=A0A9N9XAJ3_DIABA|nr:unnamed protein product [Diabrotica balteata]